MRVTDLLGDRQFSRLRMRERGHVGKLRSKRTRKHRTVSQNMFVYVVADLPVYVM